MKLVRVQSGEVAFSSEPTQLNTVVGVCVAVCIWDKKRGLGGMCHYGTHDTSSSHPSNDVGRPAITNLLRRFRASGSLPADLQAKVLGGAQIGSSNYINGQKLGLLNIAVALKTLAEFSIQVAGEDLGGKVGRVIQFETHTGKLQFRAILGGNTVLPARGLNKSIRVLLHSTSKSLREAIASSLSPEKFSISHLNKLEPHSDALSQADVLVVDFNHPPSILAYLKAARYGRALPVVLVSSAKAAHPNAVVEAMKEAAFEHLDTTELSILHVVLKSAVSPNRIQARSTSHSHSRLVMDVSDPLLSRWVVIMGASTGGMAALEQVLVRLPANMPPIVVVQHTKSGYSSAFAQHLDTVCAGQVREAETGASADVGTVHLAPGDRQLRLVEHEDARLSLKVANDPPVNRFAPSVDYLFRSALKLRQRRVLAVLLTGMGRDGAEGLLQLHQQGACTIAQDASTSVVFGMPRCAIELGAVAAGTPLPLIASNIISIIRTERKPLWRTATR